MNIQAEARISEPLALHPVQIGTDFNRWNRDLGQFGESLVRNSERVQGKLVYNLNVGEHGIDALVRSVGADGRVEYRFIEVKTHQTGTDFRLNDTRLGKQLTRPVIEDRLVIAVARHPDAGARMAAAEALEHLRKDPTSIKAELHGISIGDNRYVIRAVDSATGAIQGEIASPRVTDMLENLSKRVSSAEVRRTAARHLAEFDQLQAAVKPRILLGDDLARGMGKVAEVDENRMSGALREASEHIKAPGQSRWVKVGGKVFKFVGQAAGPAGVVIEATVFTLEAAEIEQRFERGVITREQADAEQARHAVRTAGTAGGAIGGVATGAAIGTFLCPGPGTVVGGIVGGIGGAIGADLVMATTGLTDVLTEYLQPGVEGVRYACSSIADGAAWTWGKAVSGYATCRGWLP